MPACRNQLPRKFPTDAAGRAKYEYRFICHVSCSISYFDAAILRLLLAQ
jgi:hypothetical protein